MISISGYDGWKTASPYDEDDEWPEVCEPTCEAELDYAPDDHTCNDNCAPEEDAHFCGWNGQIEASCVGNEDEYTRYWTCGSCDTDHADEVRN
jgi:hypothetical protein